MNTLLYFRTYLVQLDVHGFLLTEFSPRHSSLILFNVVSAYTEKNYTAKYHMTYIALHFSKSLTY